MPKTHQSQKPEFIWTFLSPSSSGPSAPMSCYLTFQIFLQSLPLFSSLVKTPESLSPTPGFTLDTAIAIHARSKCDFVTPSLWASRRLSLPRVCMKPSPAGHWPLLGILVVCTADGACMGFPTSVPHLMPAPRSGMPFHFHSLCTSFQTQFRQHLLQQGFPETSRRVKWPLHPYASWQSYHLPRYVHTFKPIPLLHSEIMQSMAVSLVLDSYRIPNISAT